jgi:hypothetical protein
VQGYSSNSDTDATDVGYGLQAGSNVDALSIDAVSLHQHLTKVDADTELHPSVRRYVVVSFGDRILDLDGAFHGVGS